LRFLRSFADNYSFRDKSIRRIRRLGRTADMTAVVLGVGCDRGASLATLESAIAEALAGLGPLTVRCIATIDRKGNEPAILALSAARGWPLRLYPATALARVEIPSPSETVRRVMDTPSVAEAAALLAAAAGTADLLVPKRRYRGSDGKNATVAVALCVARMER
jgi:cobalt-precorrin 5A hydrolase